ncbi:MAG: tRNA uridine-5-carboxymethylaminomethyl(34) synthesis GTPase MnmE [Deltaproteobacteria bacterium]|nr:tRNA uridine-5-carboxymethylaminomethyl(34) synthesis GTPase MnmE [Deltaproteobacteria bacterium]
MKDNGTVAAISTPPGEGGIGIVRISGPDALAIGAKVFRRRGGGAAGMEERRLCYGRIIGKDGAPVDNGFMVCMKAPRSYTGLDTVELHCHGGPLVMKEALEAALEAGARLAGPGEFTRLAFLNGKLDLAQAEAVIDVIRAETYSALASARGRLEGAFSKKVRGVKDALADILAEIEARLDFPEEELPAMPDVTDGLGAAGGLLQRLIDSFEEGHALRDGVRALILGRPNVGKSSLLNILLQEERAIVTAAPGTTRDIIEEAVVLRGIPIRLMDTAGLRETLDPVEAIGVRIARERVERSDLIIFVVDATAFSKEDAELLPIADGKKLIVAANKDDLASAFEREELIRALPGRRVVFLSAQTSGGVETLKDAIYAEAAGHPFAAPGSARLAELTVTVRHRDALAKAQEAALRAGEALAANTPLECAAADLRAALSALGEITGETAPEDILERIFSNFCIGK